MTFLEAVSWDYILVCLFSLAVMILAIVYRLGSVSNFSDDGRSDDDDRGGNQRVPDEPILDLPDGVVLSDREEEVAV